MAYKDQWNLASDAEYKRRGNSELTMIWPTEVNRGARMIASLFGFACLCWGSHLPIGAQTGEPLVPTKRVTLKEAVARAKFALVTPVDPSAKFRLDRALMVWIPKDPPGMTRGGADGKAWPPSPARQAVCLFYRAGADSLIALAQVRRIPGIHRNQNIWSPMGEGYFFRNAAEGCMLRFITLGNTEVGAYSVGLTESEFDEFMNSLKPINRKGMAHPSPRKR